MLKKLSLKDKALFNKYLRLNKHRLSVYNFANIYIWKGLFLIEWAIIDGCLCIFFRDKIGCFLYLPPLGKDVPEETIRKIFGILDRLNKNKELSRIENIEGSDKDFYDKAGYVCYEKYPEYLCRRSDLVGLRGNTFKSKRAAFNYFVRNYRYEYFKFTHSCQKQCLRLYDAWAKSRAKDSRDAVYKGMLLDGRKCLKLLLNNYEALNITGRIVKVDNKLKAFTFGFELNSDVFVVLYEVTDLSVTGLAQFIFRQFCKDSGKYHYINIMDDSGLENLKKVKLSYRPVSLTAGYVAARRNA